jgi:hypothetical protein
MTVLSSRDGRSIGLAGVAVVRADDNVRRAFVVNKSLLFLTAGYDLSRISSLSACSLCISPSLSVPIKNALISLDV